jgi:hypothetical protein
MVLDWVAFKKPEASLEEFRAVPLVVVNKGWTGVEVFMVVGRFSSEVVEEASVVVGRLSSEVVEEASVVVGRLSSEVVEEASVVVGRLSSEVVEEASVVVGRVSSGVVVVETRLAAIDKVFSDAS